jgi:hypothetical protein
MNYEFHPEARAEYPEARNRNITLSFLIRVGSSVSYLRHSNSHWVQVSPQ